MAGQALSAQEQKPRPELRHFDPLPRRWNIVLPEYEINERPHPLDPYRQNILKGDYPVFGTEDLFLSLTATERIIYQYRNVPTPTGITGGSVVNPNFFGDGRQQFFNSDFAFTFDLFRGQQAFKPVDWRLKVTPVFNVNHLEVEEVGVVKVNVGEGTTRTQTDFALQEAFFEKHLFDLSDRYDFAAVEVGILPFRSDFRGFIFDDSNLGARFLFNLDENKWQFNLAFFDMLDKNTNSLLNKWQSRDQQIVIANLYRQDWPVLGYTTSLSFHYNNDERGVQFDDNGFLVSPAPVGFAQPSEVETYYFGWAGEGHLGRVNITHAFYHAFGRDSSNPFAGRDVDINAQFAALELSYDIDWFRIRAFGLYASGDDDPRDGQGRGFDAILDAPNFAGGEFSFFNGQAIKLLGTNLTNVASPLPDLQTSKFEGHSNFVNPGLLQLGGALDFEFTPEWRAQLGGSMLRFMETAPLETYLELTDIDRDIGVEFFIGTQFRPWLTNNVSFVVGASALLPGAGFEKMFQSGETLYSTVFNAQFTF